MKRTAGLGLFQQVGDRQMIAFARHVGSGLAPAVFEAALSALRKQQVDGGLMSVGGGPHQQCELIFQPGVDLNSGTQQLGQAIGATVARGVGGGILLDALQPVTGWV
jgi:hypothetical protein